MVILNAIHRFSARGVKTSFCASWWVHQNIAFVIICALSVSVYSVPAVDTLQVMSSDPVLEKWRWTAFGGNSGLVGTVWDIFEDRDGNIWFATNKGVQSYDGFDWTTYTREDGLADNNADLIQPQSWARMRGQRTRPRMVWRKISFS